jgi:hypothetical protein
MRAPTSLDELLAWYESGLVTGTEFLPLLLWLVSDHSVDELMSRVPPHLQEKVLVTASSLCEGRARGEPMVCFGPGPVADDAALDSLCRWLRARGEPPPK